MIKRSRSQGTRRADDRLRSRRAAGHLLLLIGAVGFAAGCGDDPAGVDVGATLEMTFTGLDALPGDQGTFEVWVAGGGDTISVGTLPSGSGALGSFSFTLPMASPSGVLVTFEPPGDLDPGPSPSKLMAGPFKGKQASLSIDGYVTDGRPLQPDPGAHSLFTTSNNSEGYPSAENAGLWLFTLTPSKNVHGTREVKVTPVRAGWTYEGWIVWQGSPEVWISYGKFRPDEVGLLSSRDDTGTGPFAGAEDFRNAGVEDVPGEEWTSDEIAGELGIELPGGFSLPLALDSLDAQGNALWHHVISIEPAFDLVEGPLEGRPFPVRPYENPVGAGGPGVPRTIGLVRPAPTARVAEAR
jgi:hypothetical protein